MEFNLYNTTNPIFVDLYETINKKRSLDETGKEFNINKSTAYIWHSVSPKDTRMGYKRLFIEYMINVNFLNSNKFMRNYNLIISKDSDLVNDKVISIMMSVDLQTIVRFTTSQIEWKQKFINRLKSIHKILFYHQMNIIRRRLGLSVINFDFISQIETSYEEE